MTIENGKYYELGKKTFTLLVVRRISTAVILLFVAILLGIINIMVGPALLILIGLSEIVVTAAIVGFAAFALLIGFIGFFMAKVEYKVCRIMLDESSLRIIRGVLSKEEVAIPYRRIQGVEIKQTPVHRLFEVAFVAISTTTDLEQPSEKDDEADDQTVPLMDYELAQAVTSEITKRTEVERMQIAR